MKIDPNMIPGLADHRPGGHTRTLIENLGDSFSRMLADVNQAQQAADRKIEEFATTPEKDIHGTMIAMEKAGITLRMLLQVRAKLISAYHEFSRMQI